MKNKSVSSASSTPNTSLYDKEKRLKPFKEEIVKKEVFLGTILFFICVVLLSFSFQLSDEGLSVHPRKIVVFKKWFDKEIDQDVLLKDFGAVKIKHLKLINGTAVHLTPQAEKNLKKKDEILRVDEDLVIHVCKKKPHLPEEVPWGIDRIEADVAWETTTGSTIKVAIMDTGIDLDHPDLQDNIKGQVNMIKPHKSGDDDSGHGTHVAGIVAAIDNEIGVIGTGPEVSLYAVKVLNHKGIGYLSDLVDGLNWCINNEMQVVNMSFGSSKDNQSFHDAIIEAHLAGLTMVASAGNNGEYSGLIEYPAKYPETIAVSAVNEYGQFASFSSYGQEIDLTAPGVNIKSTYKKSSYEIMEGTSMSAPHVTGTAALILSTLVKHYDLNRNDKWDPEEIRMKLMKNAEHLGLPSDQQGAGLVRADWAVH
jgi:hypothetical protein